MGNAIWFLSLAVALNYNIAQADEHYPDVAAPAESGAADSGATAEGDNPVRSLRPNQGGSLNNRNVGAKPAVAPARGITSTNPDTVIAPVKKKKKLVSAPSDETTAAAQALKDALKPAGKAKSDKDAGERGGKPKPGRELAQGQGTGRQQIDYKKAGSDGWATVIRRKDGDQLKVNGLDAKEDKTVARFLFGKDGKDDGVGGAIEKFAGPNADMPIYQSLGRSREQFIAEVTNGKLAASTFDLSGDARLRKVASAAGQKNETLDSYGRKKGTSLTEVKNVMHAVTLPDGREVFISGGGGGAQSED